MKINMNSWHYNLIDNMWNGSPSRSLCIYFWQVVIRLVVCALMLTIVWGFFGMAAYAFTLDLGWLAKDVSPLWLKAVVVVFGAPFTAAFFALCILLMGLVVYGVVKAGLTIKQLFEQWDDKREKKEEKNVLIAFIKAKKQKVCPTLEFTLGDD